MSGLESSSQLLSMSQEESCPFTSCQISGSRQRLLGHIRSSHCEEELPADFVSRLNLLQCAHCKKWFQKLAQHSSQCKKRPGSHSRPSSKSGPVTCDEEYNESSFEVIPSVEEVETSSTQKPVVNSVGRSVSDPPDAESAAWQFIRDISVDAILAAIPPRTVQSVSPAVRSLFQECCVVVFRKLEQNPMDETAWKLFFLLPRMLLSPASLSRGGKSNTHYLKAIFRKFLAFQWDQLVQFNKLPAGKTHSSLSRKDQVKQLSCLEACEMWRALTCGSSYNKFRSSSNF